MTELSPASIDACVVDIAGYPGRLEQVRAEVVAARAELLKTPREQRLVQALYQLINRQAGPPVSA